MKKILLPGLLSGVVLLALSYGVLHLLIQFFPSMAEEYYNPMFRRGGDKTYLFFLHPFVLSFALAWFWNRFKDMFSGPWVLRGIELGLVYGLVATLPSMWITFSAIDLGLDMVLSWLAYGLLQASVAGTIFAWINP